MSRKISLIYCTPLPLPPDRTLPLTAVLARLAEEPDRLAITDAKSGERLTRGAVAGHVAALANGLRARGIGRGDIVALTLPNCACWPIVALGVWSTGAALAPLHPTWSLEETAHALTQIRPRLAIARAPHDRALHGALKLAAVQAEVFTVGSEGEGALLKLLRPGPALPIAAIQPNDLALVPFTSGKPRGVRVTHENLAAAAAQVAMSFALDRTYDERTVALVTAPLYQPLGFCSGLLAPLSVGASIVCSSKPEPTRVLELIEEHRVTHAVATVPLLQELAAHPHLERFDTRTLRLFATSGARVPAALELRASQRLGCAVRNVYAMTEATGFIAAPLRVANDPGTSGWLVPGTEARLIDPQTGHDVSPGRPGELWVRGPQIAKAYYDDVLATKRVFTDGWMRTGDLVSIRRDGQLVVIDRIEDLIQVYGESIAPTEIELVLREHPCVRDAAVVGRPDPEGGEVAIAYVVASIAIDAHALIEYTAPRVGGQTRLRAVHFVDELPRLPSGKLARRVLRERARASSKPVLIFS